MADDTDNADDDLPTELSIAVDPPIAIKGATYGSLDLREPLLTEVSQAEALVGNTATIQSMRRYQMMLVSKVSGWPMPALDQLPIRKFDEASEYLARFTIGGRRTGKS